MGMENRLRLIYGGVCGSNMNSGPLFISGSSSSFTGSGSMVSFRDVKGGNRSDRPFFRSFCEDEIDEDLDEYVHHPEKKRRLTDDQIQFLEKSFQVENKLEPERKILLAKDLGLQPRQIAIWFQNRRARWKTKQLEKDYEALQVKCNSIRADYDSLLKENEKLKAEVLHLKDSVLLKEKEMENFKLSRTSTTRLYEALPEEPIANWVSGTEVSKFSVVACEKKDSSPKSDAFDSESPYYIDGGHSSILELCDSSYIYEPDQSDLSQEEEDNLSTRLLPYPAYTFSNIEEVPCFDLSANSYYSGFQVEDQAFNFWSN